LGDPLDERRRKLHRSLDLSLEREADVAPPTALRFDIAFVE